MSPHSPITCDTPSKSYRPSPAFNLQSSLKKTKLNSHYHHLDPLVNTPCERMMWSRCSRLICKLYEKWVPSSSQLHHQHKLMVRQRGMVEGGAVWGMFHVRTRKCSSHAPVAVLRVLGSSFCLRDVCNYVLLSPSKAGFVQSWLIQPSPAKHRSAWHRE